MLNVTPIIDPFYRTYGYPEEAQQIRKVREYYQDYGYEDYDYIDINDSNPDPFRRFHFLLKSLNLLSGLVKQVKVMNKT